MVKKTLTQEQVTDTLKALFVDDIDFPASWQLLPQDYLLICNSFKFDNLIEIGKNEKQFDDFVLERFRIDEVSLRPITSGYMVFNSAFFANEADALAYAEKYITRLGLEFYHFGSFSQLIGFVEKENSQGQHLGQVAFYETFD